MSIIELILSSPLVTGFRSLISPAVHFVGDKAEWGRQVPVQLLMSSFVVTESTGDFLAMHLDLDDRWEFRKVVRPSTRRLGKFVTGVHLVDLRAGNKPVIVEFTLADGVDADIWEGREEPWGDSPSGCYVHIKDHEVFESTTA